MSTPIKTLTIAIIAFCGIAIFSNCNSSDNSEGSKKADTEITGDVYVRYLAEERASKMAVSLYTIGVDGKRLAYEEPVKMWYQGRALEAAPVQIKKGSYQIDVSGLQPDTMEYRIETGKKSDLAIDIDLKSQILPEITNLTQIDGLILDFKNAPLQENESLIVVITDKNNKSLSETVNGPINSVKTIGKSDINALAKGEIELYMVQKKRYRESVENFIFNIDREYYFKKLVMGLN